MTYLDTNQRLLIETQVTARRKSIGLAYVLWFFLGVLSIHRFYLERPGSAILQIVLNCVLVGLIWTLIDAFLIPGMIRDFDNKNRAELYRLAGGPLPGYGGGPDTSRWSAADRERHERELALRQPLAPAPQVYAPPAAPIPDMSRWSQRDRDAWFAAHPEVRSR